MKKCRDCDYCYRLDLTRAKCTHRAWIDIKRNDDICCCFVEKAEIIKVIEEAEDEQETC